MAEWQKIYENTIQHRAAIVKGVLEEQGIASVVVPKKDSAYQLFGHFEVLVAPDDVIRAIKIVTEDIKFE
jgi:hypothetical protein